MLGKEDFLVIQALARRGVYQKDIAHELGVHPKTVSRALARGGPAMPRRGARPSKLDPYKAHVDALLVEGVWNAVVILREVEALGYQGRISILRDYLRPKRPLRKSRATVRFETKPGQQMQSDWGTIETVVGGESCQAEFEVNTLGFSRRFHFWATESQDAEHTYEGVVRAFEYFGGVTEEVLVDNQKPAVLSHPPGQRARFHPRFVDLAGHYGFRPRACRARRARTKGKDERMVGYIKQHFFVRYRRFDSFAHLNQLAERWLAEEADQRIHGTLKEVVAERFAREAAALGPLPRTRYDTSYREQRLVAWDGYIEVRGNRYSVPARLVGETVEIRISLDSELSVWSEGARVCRHRLQDARQGWVCVPEHHRSLWREAVAVETRPLQVYEEVAGCS